MSLEQALENHAAALREFISAFSVPTPLATSFAENLSRYEEKPQEPSKVKKSAQSAKVAEPILTPSQEALTVSVPAAKIVTEPETTASAEPTEQVTYAQARELVLKLASANKRDEVKAVNTAHKIAKLGALLKDENDFNSVIDNEKLQAVYADLLAIGV